MSQWPLKLNGYNSLQAYKIDALDENMNLSLNITDLVPGVQTVFGNIFLYLEQA